jgi:hypothetical protein
MLSYVLAGRSQNVLFKLYLIATRIDYKKSVFFLVTLAESAPAATAQVKMEHRKTSGSRVSSMAWDGEASRSTELGLS